MKTMITTSRYQVVGRRYVIIMALTYNVLTLISYNK